MIFKRDENFHDAHVSIDLNMILRCADFTSLIRTDRRRIQINPLKLGNYILKSLFILYIQTFFLLFFTSVQTFIF